METPRHVARVGHLTTNVLIRNSSFAYGFERKARSVAVVYSNHREKLWIFRSRVSGRERLFFFFFFFFPLCRTTASNHPDRSKRGVAVRGSRNGRNAIRARPLFLFSGLRESITERNPFAQRLRPLFLIPSVLSSRVLLPPRTNGLDIFIYRGWRLIE